MANTKLLVFWLAGVLLASTVESRDFWQFGQNSRDLVLVDQQRGTINPKDFNKPISIRVPACMKVTYVIMAIYDQSSPPLVSYNNQLNKLKVMIKPGQNARFRYEMTAKGKQTPNCSEHVEKNAGNSKKKLGCAGGVNVFWPC